MSSPAEFYQSLPPITKAYGTACLVVTVVCQIGLLSPADIAYFSILDWQVWRLITNFFFLGKFSINFGIRLLMIARYGVQLENGPFQRRTADFLWMMLFGAFSLLVLSIIPIFSSHFLGISLVFMLLYLWSREFPNANINLYGLVTLKAFYLPWAMLCLDVIFGSPIVPDLLGIIAGHLYYFLTVLHPLAGGKNILKTPAFMYPYVLLCNVIYQSFKRTFSYACWLTHRRMIHLAIWKCEIISLLFPGNLPCAGRYGCNKKGMLRHKQVMKWRIGAPPPSSVAQQQDRATGVAFRGRSYRLGG